jgi:hypothetical protein
MLTSLLAAINQAPAMQRSGSGASVPPPAEQVEAFCSVIRTRIGAGEAQPFIVPIPVAFYKLADGVTNAAWAPKGNPAQGYADECRKRLCGAKGGDGTAVWVSQYTELGTLPADAPENKRPILGAGLEVASASGLARISCRYLHLQAWPDGTTAGVWQAPECSGHRRRGKA